MRLLRVTRADGYSFVELLVVTTIILILASAVQPLARVTLQRSREIELRRALREMRDAIDAHKQAVDEGRVQKRAGESGYPKKLEDLVAGVEDQKSPKKERIYFLRRLPRDPFAVDPALAPAETWGKRSYASPPDDPRDGEDVFDVFSLSTAIGINGRPYKEW